MATESADVLKQARRSRRIPAILPYLFYRFYRHGVVLKQARPSRRILALLAVIRRDRSGEGVRVYH